MPKDELPTEESRIDQSFPDCQISLNFNQQLSEDIQIIQLLDGLMNFAHSSYGDDDIETALAWFNAKFGDKQ